MSEVLWDQNIANAATTIGQCMTMGAVILKPPSKPPTGFK